MTWLLQSLAAAMILAGTSVIVAGVASSGMLSGSAGAAAIARILFHIGSAFAIFGGAALYLSRPRGLLLLNERAAVSDAERPAIGGWLIALAIALVALPVWLILTLLPFLAEWRVVFDFLRKSDLLTGAGSNMSGVVLLPIAAALTPPMIELAAMLAFGGFSAVLLALVLSRSPRFPRLYLVCIALLSALVIASLRGADAARLAGEGVDALIRDSSANAGEAGQLRDGLTRYTSIVSSTASALAWMLCGYLIWLPAILFSRRARLTFSPDAGGGTPRFTRGPTVEEITSPPRL
jgi:hypothetical protein